MPDEKYDKARKQRNRKYLIVLLSVFVSALLVLLYVSEEWEHEAADHGRPLRVSLAKPKQQQKPIQPEFDIGKLEQTVQELDAQVRTIKSTGVIMETDPDSLQATKALQEATRKLLHARYGVREPYRVKAILEFQKQSPDFDRKGSHGSILIELAPSSLQPHSIFMFLENARQYQGGAFHRIAGHVLQTMVKGRQFKSLAFQEYSKEFPHKKGTIGYAGRPSGPAWYVSIKDNTINHGPGSQQQKNPYEADSCFGKVIQGFNDEVQRIAKIPERGFLRDTSKHVLIKELQIFVPSDDANAVDGYVRWKDNKNGGATAVSR